MADAQTTLPDSTRAAMDTVRAHAFESVNPDGSMRFDWPKAVAAVRDTWQKGAAWTSTRKRGLSNVPSNLVKGVLSIGPGTTALAGAAVRAVPDVVRAGITPYTPEGQAASHRIGAGARAVAQAIGEGAKEAVTDPYGFVTKNPFEVLTGVNAAGKAAAGAVVKAVARKVAPEAATDAAEGAAKLAGPSWADENSALGKVAQHGPAKAAAKAADDFAREHFEPYDQMRTHQEETATVSKVLNDARVNEQIARNKDLRTLWSHYGDLSDEEKQSFGAHATSTAAGPIANDRVSLAVQAWKNLDAQTQHEWMESGRDLGPLEQVPRYQPARIEEFGKAVVDRLDAHAEAQLSGGDAAAPGGPMSTEADKFLARRGSLKRLNKMVDPDGSRLQQWAEETFPDDQEAQAAAVKRGILPHDELAAAVAKDPVLQRHLGFEVERRLQYARSSTAPGAVQRPMPKIGEMPGQMTTAIGKGGRRIYQMTRQEWHDNELVVRKALRKMPVDQAKPLDELYDEVIGGAIDKRKVVPLSVLEQNDDWFRSALSPANRRLMDATDEVREVLGKRQTSQPMYLPMMRRPLALNWKNLFRRAQKAAKPGSPFKQRVGTTYSSDEWVRDPRILGARMTGQLRSYQRAQQVFDKTMEAIQSGKIRARVIRGPEDLLPGEVAWNPDGLKLWRRQVDFGEQFLKGLQTHGVSEQGSAKALAEAVRQQIGEGAFSAVDQGYVKAKTYAIPEHVGKMLANEYKDAGPIAKTIDALTAPWRWAVLTARPAWIMNNTLGNVIFSTLNGVAPRHYLMALQEQFRAKMPDNLNGVRLTAQEADLGLVAHGGGPLGEFMEWLDSKPSPIGSIDAMTGEKPSLARMTLRIGDPRRFKAVLDGVSEAANGLNSRVESFYRSANYLKEAEKLARSKLVKAAGRSGLEAAAVLDEMDSFSPAEVEKIVAKVNYFMHDYSGLTPWERNYVRRAIPFYNFMKHQTRLLLSLPVTYPGRAVMLQAMVAVGKEMQAEDNAKMPTWARDRGYTDTGVEVTVGGRNLRAFVSTQGFNPFIVGYGPAGGSQDVQSEDFGIPEGIKFGYDASGPAPRAIAQSAERGYDVLTHKVQRAPGKLEQDGHWVDAKTLKSTSPPWVDPVSYYVAQFPQVQLAKKLINPRSGYPGAPLSLDSYHEEANTTRLLLLLKYFTSASIVLLDQNDVRQPPTEFAPNRRQLRSLILKGADEEALRQSDASSWWKTLGRGRHTDVPKPGTAPAGITR